MRISTVTTSTEGRIATVFIMAIALTGNVRIMIGVSGSALSLMFAAMIIYVMSDDLSFGLAGQPQQPLSGAAENSGAP